ncbi:unnamed protein product [Laminaria digitata]
MHRQFLKARDAFAKSADEHAQPLMRLVHHKRAELDSAWEDLAEGWKANNERAAEFGLRPRTADESMVTLNVGGSTVAVWWHLLAEAEGFGDSTLGALLEGVWDKERVPRDADGRMMLDESPACIKHIIHAMLRANDRASSVAAGLPENTVRSAVAVDEVPCLIYTAHVMRLPGCVPTYHPYHNYMNLNGGSTILEPFEIAPFSAQVRQWVGGRTAVQMTLVYRATRDGFDTRSFKPSCDEESPYTISLIRVSSGEENDDGDSVVGGYSVLPWRNATTFTISEETFLFMLKDGSATRKNPSKPIQWSPCPEQVGGRPALGPSSVEATWLRGLLGEETGGWILRTGRDFFYIEENSPFLALNGKKVVEIEVYSARCQLHLRPPRPAPPNRMATT